jgi:ankyrin repeat protein
MGIPTTQDFLATKDPQIVAEYIKNGGNVDVFYPDTLTSKLEVISQDGTIDSKIQAEIINRLVDNGAKIKNSLSNAAVAGELDAMKLLIDKGADIKTYGGPALVYAASAGQIDAMRLLIDKGVDLKSHGGAALAYAAENGQINAMTLLFEKVDPRKDGADALIEAAGNGQIDAMKLLLEKGVDPNKTNSRGMTAIWAAADRGHVDAIVLLVRNGVPPEDRDKAVEHLKERLDPQDFEKAKAKIYASVPMAQIEQQSPQQLAANQARSPFPGDGKGQCEAC